MLSSEEFNLVRSDVGGVAERFERRKVIEQCNYAVRMVKEETRRDETFRVDTVHGWLVDELMLS